MKLRKIMAGIAASAVAASSLAVAASAALVEYTGTNHAGADISTGMYLVQVFNTGNPDENKPATDYGIDLATIDGLRFTFEVDKEDPIFGEEWATMFTGGIGGGVVMSVNGGDIIEKENPDDPLCPVSEVWNTYNWQTQNWWGINDPEFPDYVTDPNLDEDESNDNPISTKALGNGVYEITGTGFVNPLSCTTDAWEIDEIGCFQVALQEWNKDETLGLRVLSCEVLDASGNALLKFDQDGNPTVPSTEAPETEAPETEAPETDAAPETQAPVTGDSTNKPNTNTGVEGIALVAGIAVLATGAIVVAKKRS